MAKRSSGQFKRRPQDDYRTWDKRAVEPLLRHLPPKSRFVEPCAGAGDLLDQLTQAGHECVGAFDINPKRQGIIEADALRFGGWPDHADLFITNPPWTRALLHELIPALCRLRPTWLLFDADWGHTQQAAPFLGYMVKVVSVGRLRWIEDSDHDGKDNCAWYLFDAKRWGGTIEFVGRESPARRAKG